MNVMPYTEKESPTSTTSPSLCSSQPSSSPSRSSNDDLSPTKPEWNFSLKGKLRKVITEKRAQSGNGEGESELDSPREGKCLNTDELIHISRQERIRKERNRLAAQRMRDRRKRYHETLVAELGGLETNNNNLESEIQELDRERERLELALLNHLSSCTLVQNVDNNRNHITGSSWTVAHNVDYLLNNNNNNGSKRAPESLGQKLIYTKTDNSSSTSQTRSDAVDNDDRGNVSKTNVDHISPDKSSKHAFKSSLTDTTIEQPLDLSTSQKISNDLPVDLRVPRGIKHKLYIQQSGQQPDAKNYSLTKQSWDTHRQYHKKLRLFPVGQL